MVAWEALVLGLVGAVVGVVLGLAFGVAGTWSLLGGPAESVVSVPWPWLLGLVTVVAGTTYAQRPVSPYLGRAADLTDTLLVVSVVPVACAVLDLYDRARGLLG